MKVWNGIGACVRYLSILEKEPNRVEKIDASQPLERSLQILWYWQNELKFKDENRKVSSVAAASFV